ncbi:recombinase family protein [Brevundimonas sp.]|uniref:recombinase family protein n=1 Tax=Brevundimonas sp. TaxID=1871086 RepID=UPI00391D0F4A
MTAAPRFVAYYRVSTDKQGRSGLGLEAQRAAVARHVSAADGDIVASFEEVESGKRANRPALAAALASCKALGATLIIAKLDRLARNARFLLTVVEGVGDAGVVFCDLPSLPAGPVGKFMLTQMAAVAELEAGLISQRTKAALQAARARGVKLGNPHIREGDATTAAVATAARVNAAKAKAAAVEPYIEAAKAAGCQTLWQIADALTARGITTPRGLRVWNATQVRRVMSSAEA